ncbi:MAG: hypothetical protein F9K16_03135 [Thermoanaerobaculia bacterium]|nr:MAG: hypothetical protein F9K16_03135 [Thermoanaerobaculia bacterium]MBZ0101186.1 hypothetical protein [Thermoanaerobaculia bacterium]
MEIAPGFLKVSAFGSHTLARGEVVSVEPDEVPADSQLQYFQWLAGRLALFPAGPMRRSRQLAPPRALRI